MSQVQNEITCFCEEVFPVTYENELDISNSSVRDDILEGRFLSFRCPACGETIKIEPRVQLRDGNDVWEVFPEEERDHFLAGNLKVLPSSHRIVFGYKEMAEKVRILGDGLDDRPLEVLKFTFLQKQGWPDNVVLFYHEKQEEKISFYLEGIKENEVGRTAVPFSFYNRIREQLSDVPAEWKDLLDPPYISVQKLALDVD